MRGYLGGARRGSLSYIRTVRRYTGLQPLKACKQVHKKKTFPRFAAAARGCRYLHRLPSFSISRVTKWESLQASERKGTARYLK